MRARQVWNGIVMLIALPAYQVWHVAKYANTRPTWPGKLGTAITFLPILAVGAAIWAFLWIVALRALWHVVN